MEIWLIEDGEKRGPYEDYEIRERIRRDELSEDVQMWYEGAERWMPAKEVHFFEAEFEEKVEEIPVPPPLPVKTDWEILWRRLGARWLDLALYSCLILFVFRLGGMKMMPDPSEQITAWVFAAHFVPAIIFEGILLHLFGLTPGKWVLRLRVEDQEGNLLSLGAAIMRSMRVWVLGVGMRMPILLLIGHLVALWMVKKRGAPLWDLVMGFRVPAAPLSAARLGFYFAVMAGIFVLNAWILWPELGPQVWPEVQKTLEEYKQAS